MLAVLFLNRMTMKRRIARKQSLSKPVKVEVEVELKAPEMVCCRTCLSTEDLESIFVSENNEKKRSHELKLVTGLEIKIGDGLSQKICNKCIERITEALKFRRTCRKAEKTLLGKKLSGRKTKKKPKLQKKGSKTTKSKKNEDIFDDDYVFDGADDFHNDNYKEDDYFDDKNLQKETCENNTSYNSARQEEDKIKSKTPGRKKRQVLPNAPPYKCNTCNKEFQMKATFKAHTRFHTNFCVCETCGKRCRNNNQLQEHKRARHGLGRIHKCAYCEYSSATKEALTIHERRHTGERPYVCDHCGATFHRRSNLVQHIAIHLPEKNFQCDMCPKRLKSRKFLQIHKHNAHTGKRYGYLCSVCDHRFEKPNKVRAHSRRVHAIPDDQQGPIVRVQL